MSRACTSAPGLVDIHVHVYAGTGMRGAYAGDNSVYPDGFTFRSGVTTVVDAGSSGWRNFPDFKDRVIDRSRTRVLALLNIVGHGMGGEAKIEQDTTDMDPKATAGQAKRYTGVVVGVKIGALRRAGVDVRRAGRGGRNAGQHSRDGRFRRVPARAAAIRIWCSRSCGRVTSTPTVPRGRAMIDDAGKVLPYLFEARKRGVIFDVGHGGGSFLLRQAVPAVQQGFLPDSISTDLHIGSMNAGMKDMLNVMSKFLNIGMPLDDVIGRSTWNPAREIHQRNSTAICRWALRPTSRCCASSRAISVSWMSTARGCAATRS